MMDFHSASVLLQLETGSIGRSSRCLHQQWGQLKVYENPPWCLISMVLTKVKNHQAQTIVIAPVWKGQPWYPVLLEMLYDYPQQLPYLSNLFQQMSDLLTSTGLIAYLWEKIGCNNLSEPVKKFFSSWRCKTSQAYDSHFRKWLGWCTKRGCDPISGHISEVAIFLADLHSQGNLTSFLNASGLQSLMCMTEWMTWIWVSIHQCPGF